MLSTQHAVLGSFVGLKDMEKHLNDSEWVGSVQAAQRGWQIARAESFHCDLRGLADSPGPGPGLVGLRNVAQIMCPSFHSEYTWLSRKPGEDASLKKLESTASSTFRPLSPLSCFLSRSSLHLSEEVTLGVCSLLKY